MYAQLARELRSDSVPYVANFVVSQPAETTPKIDEAATPAHCGEEIPGYTQFSHLERCKLIFVYSGISRMRTCAQLLPAQCKIVPVNHLCPPFYAKHK